MSKQKQSSFSLSELKNVHLGEKEIKMIKPKTGNHSENMNNTSRSTAPNVGWLYYFDYFRKWNEFTRELEELKNDKPDKEKMKRLSEHLEEKSRILFQLELADQIPKNWKLPHLNDEDRFKLTTTYPGLLAGIGYQHETKIEGELKLGFYFDYTSGLPSIPGSSIKGILRSAFRGEHWDFLREVITKNSIFSDDLPTDTELRNWELEIFEGVKNPDAAENKPLDRYLRSSGMDVFHDALIWESTHEYQYENGENQHYGDGTFLGQDFITPHHPTDRLGAFKDPVPLRFMKVLPRVTFLFQFDMKNSTVHARLTKETKLKLFKALLLNLGAGAKTNAGYGQFNPA